METEGGSGRRDAAEVKHAGSPSDELVEDRPALSVSFEDFYEIEHARLFGALVLITADRHEAEDIMQDAFLRVWERWHLVQSLASPTGYLYRTAMNSFRMRRRRALVAGRHAIRHPEELDEAEALGIKPATVRKLAQQGRDTLRRTLGVPRGRTEP